MSYYIGVDPGLSGAIGILDSKGSFVAVHDMPLIETETGITKIVNLKRVKETKREVDGATLRDILLPYKKSKAVVEQVHSMPEQGVVSVFNFGYSYGVAVGVIQSMGFNLLKVPPNKWKTRLGLDSDKNKSLDLARSLFPEASEYIKLRKNDGRAEALLLAVYLKGLKKGLKK